MQTIVEWKRNRGNMYGRNAQIGERVEGAGRRREMSVRREWRGREMNKNGKSKREEK